MKIFVFIVLVLSTLGYLSEAEDVEPRATIKEIIDGFIQSLKDEIPDPIVISDQSIPIVESDIISAYLDLLNPQISGLKFFNITVLYTGVIIPIPTGFTLDIANVELELDQSLIIEFLNSTDLSIQTDGSTDILVTDLQATGNLAYTLIPLNLTVNSLGFSVGGIKFDLKGIVNDEISELISSILTDTVAVLVNRLATTISSGLEDTINSIIAGALNTTSGYDNDVENYEEDEYDTNKALKQLFDNLLNEISLMLQQLQ